MVTLDDARVASYELNNQHFEILVDPDLALEIKQGHKDVANSLSKLLASDDVFKNAKAGDRTSEKALQDCFGTTDLAIVVDKILKHGHLDLTTEQKRKLAESKRKEVIDYIVRNSINPMTKTPHTAIRVENALDSAKINVDIQRPLDQQMEKIIEKVSMILPMDFKMFVFKVIIPIQFAGKINGIINKYDVVERKWEASAFRFTAKVPAGEKDSFMNTISGLTKGQSVFETE